MFKSCRALKTVQDCIKSDLPTIGNSIDQYNDLKTEAFIKLWLVDLNDCVNLKRPLNEGQMDFIAMQIIDKHRNMRLSDIYFIFLTAKSGGYGELYERLSPDKVLLWFQEYWNDRMKIAADLSRDEHAQSKESGSKDGNINRLILQRVGNASTAFKNLKDKS